MQQIARVYTRTMAWLDTLAFPALVGAIIFPLAIVFDLLLLPILLIFRDSTTLILLLNSYLNVASATVAAIILREDKHTKAQIQALHDKQDRHHAEHQHHFLSLHARMDALLRQHHGGDTHADR